MISIMERDLEKDDVLNKIPELYSYVTARRENFGGFLFNPYLFNEIVLNEIEIRIIELSNGYFSIQEIISTISEEFYLSEEIGKNIVFNAFNAFGRYCAIKWRRQRKKKVSEFKRSFFTNNIKKPTCHISRGENNYSAPLSVIWDITYRCNLKCKHCYVDAGNSLQNELSLEEIKIIIDQLVKMKIFSITFSGGEPLLRKDFFDILRYASRFDIGIKFSTNGVLISDQIIKKLDSINVFAVQISIDGIEKTHDTFRGSPGAFKKAVETLKKFVDAGYWTIVSTTMTKYNLNEIKSLLELAISLEAKTFKLSSFIPTGRGRKNIEDLLLSQSETKNLANEMIELKKRYGDTIQMEIEGTFPWLFEKPPINSRMMQDSTIKLGCSAGRSQIVISPDGKVFSCPFLHDFIAGDLRKEELKNIWEKSEVFSMFRNIKKEDLKGKCNTCEYIPFYCQGGCRAAAYVQSKDFYAEDPLCWNKL